MGNIQKDKSMISCPMEILPGLSHDGAYPKRSDEHTDLFFSIDSLFRYEAFNEDFGPFDISKLYRFSQILHSKFIINPTSKVYFFTNSGPKSRSNAACLIGCWMVIALNMSPERTSQILQVELMDYVPFRDASGGSCNYKMTISHCLYAIHKGISMRKIFRFPFKYSSTESGINRPVEFYGENMEERLAKMSIQRALFDAATCEYYEKVQNGDLSIVFPGKFIHFSSPIDCKKQSVDQYGTTSQDYVKLFEKCNVTDIIRLSRSTYDKSVFTKAGFKHHHLFYEDGTNPPMHVLDRFLEICRKAKGVVAVHCKAGLGRTGTCTGCYLMKYEGFSAEEAIAWLRLCRPGSVLGPQQQFLIHMQNQFQSEKDADLKNIPAPNSQKIKLKKVMKRSSKEISKSKSQGDELRQQKLRAQKNAQINV